MRRARRCTSGVDRALDGKEVWDVKKVGALAVVAAVGALVAVLAGRSGPDGSQVEQTIASVSSDVGLVQRPPVRRLSRVVDGVRFSFELPNCCWARGPIKRLPDLSGFQYERLFVTENTVGPQGAEAVVFWTSFPNGRAEPCSNLLRGPVGPSAADLASAMVRTPGIELADGPVKTSVDGRRATYVMLRVLLDLGCDPGFFFTWQPRGRRGQCLGSCWLESSMGDTIRVWVVEVDGKRLVFEAATTERTGPGVEQDIRQIVESIRFSS